MITTDELVENRIDEVKEILDDYDVYDHDVETIVGYIEELGNLIEESNKAAKQMKEYILLRLGQDGLTEALGNVKRTETAAPDV